MAPLRVSLFVLASLAAVSRALPPAEHACDAGDNMLLVQKGLSARQGDLHLSSAGELLASLSPSQEALLRKVHTVVRQLPFALPANVSMEDLMAMGQKVLSTFQNKSFVTSLHYVIGNMTLSWAELLGDVKAAMATLDANCSRGPMNATVKTLESAWKSAEVGMHNFYSKVVQSGKELMQKHPYEVKTVMDALAPLFNVTNASGVDTVAVITEKLTNLTKGFAGDCSKYQSEALFSDASKVCPKFQSIWPNVTAVGDGLEKGVSMIKDTARALPGMEQLIVALVPDAGDRVLGFLNTTVKAALNITTSAVPVTRGATAAVKTELEKCLYCKMPSPEEAGSARYGLSTLSSFVVALSASLALRQ